MESGLTGLCNQENGNLSLESWEDKWGVDIQCDGGAGQVWSTGGAWEEEGCTNCEVRKNLYQGSGPNRS